MIAIESIFCCKMRLDRGGHAQRADHQGDQADQRKEGRRLPQPLFDQRMRFAVIGDERLRGRRCAVRSRTVLIGIAGGILNRNRSAARLPAISSPVRSSPSRDIITRGPTLRLPVIRSGSFVDLGADAKRLPADANRVADMRVQAQQYAIGHRDGIGLQRGAHDPSAD